jgi:type I restriction enzyme S subunit
MLPTKNSYLRFISFKDLTQWYVEYYLSDSEILSRYSLVPIKDVITPKKDLVKKEEYDGVLPIVEKIVFKTGEVIFREKNSTGMDLYALKQNELLISNINFHQGATALNTFGDIVASTHYQPYTIKLSVVDPLYLTMVLRSQYFLNIVSGKKAQGIKNESGFSFIGNFRIPLPTIKEQINLVAQYNAQMQEAESLIQTALQIENDIDLYILNKLDIVSFKNNEKIKRDEKYNFLYYSRLKYLSRWDIYNLKDNKESQSYSNVQLANIVVSKPQYGAGYSSIPYNGKIRYIRITDINEDGSLNNNKVSAKAFSESYLLKENDFLIARSGNTVGKTFLYKADNGKAIFAGYLIRFELNKSLIIPEYLLAYTKCSIYKKWIKSNMKVSAQPNINSKQYLESPIILPPLEVQQEIVDFITVNKEKATILRKKAEMLIKLAKQQFEDEIFVND